MSSRPFSWKIIWSLEVILKIMSAPDTELEVGDFILRVSATWDSSWMSSSNSARKLPEFWSSRIL